MSRGGPFIIHFLISRQKTGLLFRVYNNIQKHISLMTSSTFQTKSEDTSKSLQECSRTSIRQNADGHSRCICRPYLRKCRSLVRAVPNRVYTFQRSKLWHRRHRPVYDSSLSQRCNLNFVSHNLNNTDC